jgi:soluble lytic murein transglycosylase
VLHDIALFGALNQDPGADEWLAAVPGSATDKAIATWRVRNALLHRQWETALTWIDVLDLETRNSPAWRYWQAYALAELGKDSQAADLYAQIVEERNYYGFLAADHLQRPYSMNNERKAFDATLLDELKQAPGFVRAHELLLLDMRLDARREWQAAIAGLDKEQLAHAAELARRWGWHDRAIATAANARYWSDLVLRFPLAHRDLIETNADRYDIDPALIYGVVRQESAFMEDAHSRVGAMGLMQLMPATARLTAKAAGLRYPGRNGLLEPDHNIRLGSAYFRRMLDRFDDSPVLAASAYNAGPHRVQRWLPKEETLPADLWLLRIPFKETHGYVQNVLAYAAVFDWRTQRNPTRMSARMPPVSPAD